MRERCKLCRRHDELRRSHIVSRFALRDAQGVGGPALLRVSNEEAPRLPRDQSWDVEYLFCGDCERRRRDWEAIVAATLIDRAAGHPPHPDLRVDDEHPDHMIHRHAYHWKAGGRAERQTTPHDTDCVVGVRSQVHA